MNNQDPVEKIKLIEQEGEKMIAESVVLAEEIINRAKEQAGLIYEKAEQDALGKIKTISSNTDQKHKAILDNLETLYLERSNAFRSISKEEKINASNLVVKYIIDKYYGYNPNSQN